MVHLALAGVALDPRRLQDGLEREPLLGPHAQQRRDELARLRRDLVPHWVAEVILAVEDGAQQHGLGRVAVRVERVVAGDEDVHEHAQRPVVDGRRVGLVVDHFGRAVGPRAAHSPHHVVRRLRHQLREPEVGDLDLRVGRLVDEEDILGLEVAVCDAALVDVL